MRVFRTNFVGHLQQRREGRRIDSWVATSFAYGGQNIFRRNIADQSVSGERAATKPGKGGVKATAARFIGREDFFFGILRAAV